MKAKVIDKGKIIHKQRKICRENTILFVLESFDFTKPPSISIRGFKERSTRFNGWKPGASNSYKSIFENELTLNGVKGYVRNNTFTVQDMINDAIDADGKNVSHKDFWTPHIGKLQRFREELGGKNFQTFFF